LATPLPEETTAVSRPYLCLKLVGDRVGSALGLVLVSPLLALAVAAIRITVGPPVLFQQQRPGLHGRPFVALKLRTMTDARDAEGGLLSDKDRVTGLGRLLRRCSIDELPQLWNVLRGEMSLVGPRPLLMEYLPRYSQEQMRRHLVKPGITGLAQVSGRNAMSWEERFRLDVWYVDHHSLWLDLRILALSVLSVVRGSGISQQGEVGMQEFLGSDG
jgi:lipopolysaccharide/colanic/teichoic acid biosynthesis glycosyltransferase